MEVVVSATARDNLHSKRVVNANVSDYAIGCKT